MNAATKLLVKFLKNEDGPTAVEYAVMLALIVVVCIASITTLGSNANSTCSSDPASPRRAPAEAEPPGNMHPFVLRICGHRDRKGVGQPHSRI